MSFDEILSCLLTEFLARYVAEEQHMAAAEHISAIVAFGLRKTEESMQRAFCEAFNDKLPEIRRCVIDELFHSSNN